MHIKEYLWKSKMKQKDFAKLVGITNSYLSALLNGRYRPSVELCERIQKETNGDVKKEEVMFPKY